MLRRVLSVLRRKPGLGRSVLACTAALGLALACLNPQNDDLPSSNLSPDDSNSPRPVATGNGQTAGQPPPANNNGPTSPDFAPAPQDPATDPLPPPEEPGPSPGDEGVSAEPDAGTSPDAGDP